MGTDSLYYIMDYSGNYYRTNQADQLVSVVSQQDAMVFTFAQANSRICVGKKAAFYCMIPIEDSEDETDAAECEEVSPAEEMGVNDMEKQENTGVEEYFSPIKELTYAHCNAAQGYKVFKRLRELRIEKKAKTKELNCLYALTDYMDCDALADTCEDNLAEIKGIMEVQEANDVTRIQPVENGEIQVVANIKDMVG